MKLFSNTALALCTAGLLLTTISMAQATRFNATNNNTDQRITYTASGKTNIQTVRLFQQLLKNSRNLTVSSHITHRPKQQTVYSTQRKTLQPSVDYTIEGKTSLKNVKQLMNLFRNNKHIEMFVEAKTNSPNNDVKIARFTIKNNNLYNPNSTYNHVFHKHQSVYSHYYTNYVPYNVWRVTEQFNGYPMPTKAQLHQQKSI